MVRRRFVQTTTALGWAEGAVKGASAAFWPNRARFVVSHSPQMDAGAQPDRGAAGPGKEGIPRLLERASYQANGKAIGWATRKKPTGFNVPAMARRRRRSEFCRIWTSSHRTDDLSRNDPFLIPVRRKLFARAASGSGICAER